MKDPARLLLFVFAPFLTCLLFFDPNLAYAFEKRVAGDMVVEEDKTVSEVSTAWGDVLVEGRVEGGVRSGFGDIRIEGPVGGDVKTGSG